MATSKHSKHSKTSTGKKARVHHAPKPKATHVKKRHLKRIRKVRRRF